MIESESGSDSYLQGKPIRENKMTIYGRTYIEHVKVDDFVKKTVTSN